ncbi:MAG TPA: hypothetical protein DEP45_04045, partial [Armatimonadetes bacterium]|nr:hypothetical protein [Armatimonadota bacterium]
MRRPMLLAVALCILLASAALAQPLRVAVYEGGLGGKAVAEALAAQEGFEATLIGDLTADTLLQHDALFVGSTRLDDPASLNALRLFAGVGGGIVLNHSATGRDLPQTPFPAVASLFSGRREDTIVLTAGGHPIAQGLPAEFEHAYSDHLLLTPGEAGTPVLRDRS